MKKRIACILLALVMFVGMFPMTAMTASAAATTTSDKAVELIKSFEGFEAKATDDGNPYTIGYGTTIEKDAYPSGIDRATGEVLLRNHLSKVVEPAITKFASSNGLNLSQAQFDALASFCYNCGTAWLGQNGTLRSAILNKAKGNNFLYAMGLWSTAGGQALAGLANRRMAEANLYLNGTYSSAAPSNYTYVFLDGNNDGKYERLHAYDAYTPTTVTYVPVKSGSTFYGWLNESNETVSQLDLTTKGMKLKANWGLVGQDYAVTSYKVEASKLLSLNVHEDYDRDSKVLKVLKATDYVTITREFVDENLVKWGKTADGCVMVSNVNDTSASNTYVTIKVTVDNLNYRTTINTTGSGSVVKGQLKKNTQLIITQVNTTAVTGEIWGKIGTEKVGDATVANHWIRMDGNYTDYEEVMKAQSGTTTTDKVIDKGTVAASKLEVRATAASDSPVLAFYLSKGDPVSILEKSREGNKLWGKIKINGVTGWINMAYVDTGATGDDDDDDDYFEPVDGIVVNTDVLNVRANAGVSNALVKTITRGTKVTITQRATVDNAPWGKIGDGQWVALYYIKQNVTSSGTGSTEAVQFNGIVNSYINLNVREQASAGSGLVMSLPHGTKISIYETTVTNGVKWGRIDNGWVCMLYVTEDKSAGAGTGTGTVPGTGTGTGTGTGSNAGTGTVSTASGVVVSSINLNVRKGPGANYTKVASLAPGTNINIYEQVKVGGMIWGRIGADQWVSLSYVMLNNGGSTGTGVMGTIARCFAAVNVRSAPGTGNALVGTIAVGSRVEILDQTMHAGDMWGQVAQGWICMDYVLLDSELPNAGGDTTIGGTGTTTPDGEGDAPIVNTNPEYPISNISIANSSKKLDVYKDAATDTDVVGEMTAGNAYTVSALKAEGSNTWAKVAVLGATGWVNLSDINYTTGKGAIAADKVSVYELPTSGSAAVKTYYKGKNIELIQVILNAGSVWGKTTDGWLNLADVKMGVKGYEILNPAVTAVFTAKADSDLNIHTDACTPGTYVVPEINGHTYNYTPFNAGETVGIAEVKQANGLVWGKASKQYCTGWVNLCATTFSVSGTVEVNDPNTLPVYDVPGGIAQAGLDLANGTVITITNVQVDPYGAVWGKTKVNDTNATQITVWVNLTYVNSIVG